MKPEFYNTSKRANVYNSIFIYKVVSLVVAVVLAAALAISFFRDKALYKEFTDSHPTAFFIVVAICLVVYVLSIIVDFFIFTSYYCIIC